MTCRQRLLLTGWLLIGTNSLVGAQNQPLVQWQQQLATYRSQSIPEKLFVHTDRSFYLIGEVIWFRLFDVDGSLHRPLNLSRVVYLELLDKDQKAVLQTKVPIQTGRGMGSLLLPTSLPAGSYVLRAYTAWMKATSPDFLFEKVITIVNPFRPPGLPVLTDSLTWDVHCFPEGGNLVTGLPAKVAFKAVDKKTGLGIDCGGVLLNQVNDTIARFASLRFGMGTFSFTPSTDNTYRIRLSDHRGRVLNGILPTIDKQGYTLQADDLNAQELRVTVRVNGLPDKALASAVYLIAHTRQSVKAAEMRLLTSNQATFIIPKNALGDGISHLTVFDADARPVCERLYFKRPQPSLTIGIKPDETQYTTRAPIKLTLATADPAGKPVVADLSVSVFRLDSLQPNAGETLPDYLWLTSDLRGFVESPNYYLTHTGPEADMATDNLMLTHGWRRFRWESAQPVKPDSTGAVPEHGGLVIRGRVTDVRTGAPANGIITYLSVPGKAIQLLSAQSDAQGMVRFELRNFYGTRDIVLQTATPDSAFRVDLINPYVETAPQTPWPVFDLANSQKESLNARSLSMQVQNSYHHQYADHQQPFKTDGDSTTFYGVADERYLLDVFTRFTVMEEVLSEYVPGVIVRRRNKHIALRVLNSPYRANFEDAPLILLDGVPVTDTDRLMAFSPLKIKALDVVTRRYFLGYSNLPGIISFKTYKGDLAGYPLDPRAVVLEYDGLQVQREFYAPQYATKLQLDSRLPDFRNLLYWNPSVTTGTDGKAERSFYTSDQEGTYLIVVQGLTANGQFSSTQHRIVVRPRPD